MRFLTIITLAYAMAFVITVSLGLPVLDAFSGIDNDTIAELQANLSDTPKNLYVVKAVVYEIGILTDVGDNDTSIESQERIDLTFFDAHTNGSHIDLGNIPLPIQANVSGQILTGIAPVHIGAFSSPSELLSALPLTGTIVNITHSDTAFYQITASNTSSAEKPHLVAGEKLSDISDIAMLFPGYSIMSLQDPAEQKSAEKSNMLERDEYD